VPTLGRKLLAEGIGTALLLTVVIGSGIMAERLSAATPRSRCWPTRWRPSAVSMS
jgi:glycerol uptake facilitator-like aquaporin